MSAFAFSGVMTSTARYNARRPADNTQNMEIASFETEHFFARYEFRTPWQLCNSDCESLSITELLELADIPMDALGEERLIYTDTAGSPSLREAISGLYQRVEAEHVLVLGTPVEGIYLAARSLLRPGDEVIVTSPAYDALINLFEHVAGAEQVKRWNFAETDSGWQLDLEQLEALITPRTRLLVINFPHNPTGFVPSPAWLRELVNFAEASGVTLFCDEMYHGLVHAGTPAIPSVADLSSSAVVLSGLSKTHGLPGLRCGWLVVRDADTRASLMNWKYYTSICPAVPTEFLSAAAIGVAEKLRLRSLATLEKNLALAESFFARWPGLFEWHRPLGGSTALLGFHVPSVNELSARLAAEEGILIQSGAMLCSSDRHMRIGLGRKNFGEALDRFEDWLRRSDLAASRSADIIRPPP
jgi:aspartate/methionine/tyrosine aminotransferase